MNLHASSIPRIGLGTYQLKGTEGIKIMEAACNEGYRHIDTAFSYENESEVGKAIQNSGIERSDFFITSKIWPTQFKNVEQATKDSLKKLQVQQIDLMLLHWPSENHELNLKAIEQLYYVQQKGFVKQIGVSNFNIAQLKDVLQIAPVICNQVEYHPYLSQEKMLDFLRKNDMLMTAYRPLAFGKVTDDPTLLRIAERYSKSPAQIALRWLIQQEVIIIPKTASVKRLKENISVFDFDLDENDMKEIFSIAKGNRLVDPSFSPEWDE